MKKEEVNKQDETCSLVKNLIDTCGELWSLCHTDSEVKGCNNGKKNCFVQQWIF